MDSSLSQLDVRRARGSAAHDLRRERLERVPVIRALAERDAETGAPECAELVHHGARVLHRPAQVARARGAIRAAAPVALEDLVRAGGALRIRPQVEAEVHRAHDRLRIALLRLAPLVENAALVLPVVGADVRAVPPVGELRRRAERALLAAAADPDGDSRLERLRVVRRVRDLKVLALEVGAPLLRIEEHAHDLSVFLEHVLARADRGKRVAVGLGLDVVPPGAQPAVDAPVRQVVDRGERLGEQRGVAIHHAVHATAQADALGVHRGRRQRGDGLVAIHVAAARRRLLEVVGHREPVEAPGVGELPQLAHLGERAAHVPDVDAEFHVALLFGARGRRLRAIDGLRLQRSRTIIPTPRPRIPGSSTAVETPWESFTKVKRPCRRAPGSRPSRGGSGAASPARYRMAPNRFSKPSAWPWWPAWTTAAESGRRWSRAGRGSSRPPIRGRCTSLRRCPVETRWARPCAKADGSACWSSTPSAGGACASMDASRGCVPARSRSAPKRCSGTVRNTSRPVLPRRTRSGRGKAWYVAATRSTWNSGSRSSARTRSSLRACTRAPEPTPRTAEDSPASCASWTSAAFASPTTPATTCSRRSATSRSISASACCSSTSRGARPCSSPGGRASCGSRPTTPTSRAPIGRSRSRSTTWWKSPARDRWAGASSSTLRSTPAEPPGPGIERLEAGDVAKVAGIQCPERRAPREGARGHAQVELALTRPRWR